MSEGEHSMRPDAVQGQEKEHEENQIDGDFQKNEPQKRREDGLIQKLRNMLDGNKYKVKRLVSITCFISVCVAIGVAGNNNSEMVKSTFRDFNATEISLSFIEYISAIKNIPFHLQASFRKYFVDTDRNTESAEGHDNSGKHTEQAAIESLSEKMIQLLALPLENEAKPETGVSATEEKINQLVFASYSERNKCDINRGIHIKDFNNTVSKIAKLLNMPDELKETIVDAANFDDGKVDAVRLLNFESSNGFMYFGKFAIVKISSKKLAFSYSLHGIKFELGPKELQPTKTVEDFILFTDTVRNMSGQVTKVGRAFIKKKGIQEFSDHYLQKASQEFEKQCSGILKQLREEEQKLLLEKSSNQTTDQSQNNTSD